MNLGILELVLLGIGAWLLIGAVRNRSSAPKRPRVDDRPPKRHHPDARVDSDHQLVRGRRWKFLLLAVLLLVLLQGLAGSRMPLVAGLVPVGLLALFAYWLVGGSHRDRPRSASHLRPPPRRAPAPIPPRPPKAPPTPPLRPVADQYPEEETWIGAVGRTFAMLALFASGGVLFLFLFMGKISRHETRFESPFRRSTINTVEDHRSKLSEIVFSKAEAMGPRTEPYPISAPHPSEPTRLAHDQIPVEPGPDGIIPISSRGRDTVDLATSEALTDAAHRLVERMERELSVAADGWVPDLAWVAKNAVKRFKHEKNIDSKLGTRHTVHIDADLSPKRLDQAYEQFRSTRIGPRTEGLAKGYAGSVLLLGGLAIFLRLGTGRHAKLPLTKRR